MPKTITVDGVKYAVTEQPSYDASFGCRRAVTMQWLPEMTRSEREEFFRRLRRAAKRNK